MIIGGAATLLIAILHVGIIIGGASWYRFFGAGEGMAMLAESGDLYPALITGFLVLVFLIWSGYAFSGAGLLPAFPLLKPILVIIAFIFLARGILGIPIIYLTDHPYALELKLKMPFMVFSSVVSLLIGGAYMMGARRLS